MNFIFSIYYEYIYKYTEINPVYISIEKNTLKIKPASPAMFQSYGNKDSKHFQVIEGEYSLQNLAQLANIS